MYHDFKYIPKRLKHTVKRLFFVWVISVRFFVYNFQFDYDECLENNWNVIRISITSLTKNEPLKTIKTSLELTISFGIGRCSQTLSKITNHMENLSSFLSCERFLDATASYCLPTYRE